MPAAMSATHSQSYAWTDTLKGIYYGPGSLKSALPQLLGTLKASRALVVTGKTLHEKVTFNTDVCDRGLIEVRLISFEELKQFSTSPMHTVQRSTRSDSMLL